MRGFLALQKLVLVSVLFFIIEFLEDDESPKRFASASMFKKASKKTTLDTETTMTTTTAPLLLLNSTKSPGKLFKWFKSGPAVKNVTKAVQYCESSAQGSGDMEFLNQGFQDERYHSFTPLIEAQLLQFTLEERLFYWTVHVLASKTTHASRMEVVDLYDRLLLDKKRQRFKEKLAAELANDFPFTQLLLSSMTKTTRQLNEHTLNFYLDVTLNELEESENVGSIVQMLVDISPQERSALIHSYELQGRSLAHELAHAVDASETSDLLVQLLNGKNSIAIAFNPTAISEQAKLLSSNMVPTNGTQDRRNQYRYLNRFLTVFDSESSRALLASFREQNQPLTLKKTCHSLRLDPSYCDLTGLIESYRANKTVHLANRIRAIIIQGYPSVELIRLLLKAADAASRENHEEDDHLKTIEALYQKMYGIELAKHLEMMLFRHEEPEHVDQAKKPWWKFWARDRRQHGSERLLFTKALQAFIHYPDWCRDQCDILQKFKATSRPKSRNPFSRIFGRVNEKTEDKKAKTSGINQAKGKLKKKVIETIV